MASGLKGPISLQRTSPHSSSNSSKVRCLLFIEILAVAAFVGLTWWNATEYAALSCSTSWKHVYYLCVGTLALLGLTVLFAFTPIYESVPTTSSVNTSASTTQHAIFSVPNTLYYICLTHSLVVSTWLLPSTHWVSHPSISPTCVDICAACAAVWPEIDGCVCKASGVSGSKSSESVVDGAWYDHGAQRRWRELNGMGWLVGIVLLLSLIQWAVSVVRIVNYARVVTAERERTKTAEADALLPIGEGKQ